MREIVLDTETTGLDPLTGHRIVEIGCVELVNHLPTDNHFWKYLDPERDMPEEAFRVHGLSREFLTGKDKFADIADEFLDFIGDDKLVIHNASFDMGFLNAEMARLKRPPIPFDRAIDTVTLARERFPGAQVNLDALCRRFQIDNSGRDLHGALLDSRLLAEVYLELIGGRQPDLELASDRGDEALAPVETAQRATRPPRPHAPLPAEREAHARLLEKIADPIWTTGAPGSD
ncbi:MAG: DNA polymerase III subunit epsilon [Hyphomicrobiales bacterium]|nr:DNA polymerase III subunit epsilon [Hyphomicrobiales bacterium]